MALGQKRKLLALLFALFLYLILGAAIFWKVEEREGPRETLLKGVYEEHKVGEGNMTFDKFKEMMHEVEHVFRLSHFGESTWNFYSALYFCGSVVTTIGKFESRRILVQGRVDQKNFQLFENL